MTGRIGRINAREVEAILARHGFELVSQKGSHRKWRHPEAGLQVIVPRHGGAALPVGTLRNILQNAEIPETEWRE